MGSFSIPAGTNSHTLSSLKQHTLYYLTNLEVGILNPFLWVKIRLWYQQGGLLLEALERTYFLASPSFWSHLFPWQVAPPSVLHAGSRVWSLISHLRISLSDLDPCDSIGSQLMQAIFPLKVFYFITSAKSLLPRQVTYSHIPGTKPGCPWWGQYCVCPREAARTSTTTAPVRQPLLHASSSH